MEFAGSPSGATKDRRCKASSGGCRLSGRHADPENHDYEGILQYDTHIIKIFLNICQHFQKKRAQQPPSQKKQKQY